MATSSRQARYHALLIGINAYASKPLRGCVNDVHRINDILKEQRDVEPRILTATQSEEPRVPGQLPPLPFAERIEDLPTRANVNAALVKIRDEAAPGDYVYIHYSGHGQYLPPSQDPNNLVTNRLTGDLALVLLNGQDPTVVEYMTGHHLAIQLNVMIRKAIVLTVVLDCCYSATAYRDENIRCLPSGHRSSHNHNEHRSLVRSVIAPSDMRDISMDPNWAMNPEGYSILTAAGPREEAPEIQVGGKYYGKLSYFLHGLHSQNNGLAMRQTTVFRHLRARYMAEFKHDGGHTPCLYGKKDMPFFGPPPDRSKGWEHPGPADQADISIIRDPDGGLILLAGEAHGLVDGDQVDVYAYGSGAPVAPLAILGIRTTGVTTSLLQPPAEPRLATRAAPGDDEGLLARVRFQQRLGAFPVRLDPTLEDLAHWRTVVSSLGLVVASSEDPRFSFHVRLAKDPVTAAGLARYQILDASGNEYANLPPLPQDRTETDDVVAIVHHLAKYAVVRDLSSGGGGGPSNSLNNSFRDSFDVFVKTSSGDHQSGQLIELQVNKEGVSPETIQWFIRNNGTQNLYVYVYALSPYCWEVQHIHHATFEVALPAAINDQKPGYKTQLLKKLRPYIPKEMLDSDVEYCEDTIKVFVTTRWTSFDQVELGKIWTLPDKSRPVSMRNTNTWNFAQVDEAWACFSFPFRTKIIK